MKYSYKFSYYTTGTNLKTPLIVAQVVLVMSKRGDDKVEIIFRTKHFFVFAMPVQCFDHQATEVADSATSMHMA